MPTLTVSADDSATAMEEIVQKELELNKLPFMLCRTMPNGEKEYWKLEELI